MTAESVCRALASIGATVDDAYGAIIVNPVQGDFVMRADASVVQMEALSRLYPIECFPDAPIMPAKRRAVGQSW